MGIWDFKIIFELWDKTERARSIFLLVPKSVQESYNEHTKIKDAIIEKKLELAINLLKRHKERSFTELIDLMNKKLDDDLQSKSL